MGGLGKQAERVFTHYVSRRGSVGRPVSLRKSRPLRFVLFIWIFLSEGRRQTKLRLSPALFFCCFFSHPIGSNSLSFFCFLKSAATLTQAGRRSLCDVTEGTDGDASARSATGPGATFLSSDGFGTKRKRGFLLEMGCKQRAKNTIFPYS